MSKKPSKKDSTKESKKDSTKKEPKRGKKYIGAGPPGFVIDFRDLFYQWKTCEGPPSFANFRATWERKKMSYIHFARIKHITPASFISALCGAAYFYFYLRDYRISLGALYSLYMIHETQPQEHRHQLPVSQVLWNKILEVRNSKGASVGDAVAVLHKMVTLEMFCFSLAVEVLPPPEYWTSNDTPSVVTGNLSRVDVEAIARAVAQYKELRSVLPPDKNVLSESFVGELRQVIGDHSNYQTTTTSTTTTTTTATTTTTSTVPSTTHHNDLVYVLGGTDEDNSFIPAPEPEPELNPSSWLNTQEEDQPQEKENPQEPSSQLQMNAFEQDNDLMETNDM